MEDRFLINCLEWTWFWYAKRVLHCSHQFRMLKVSRSNHIDVFPHIVLVVKVLYHSLCYCLHVADIPQNRKTNLLTRKNTPMRNLNSCLQRHCLPCLLQFPLYCPTFIFDILFAIEGISEHIPNNSNRFGEIFAKRADHIGCILTRCVGVEVGSDILNL